MSGLSVHFGDARVLHGLDADLGAPGCISLTGDNGSGKSTLLRVLAGLLSPTEGEVTLDGHRPDSRHARALRGFVQDEPPLYEYLTVREQLTFVCRLWGVPLREALSELERLGAHHWCDTLIRDVSLGTRKKVGLVAAVLHQPQVVLLDEPFNALDATATAELTGMISNWRTEGRLVMVVSHHTPPGLVALTDRRLLLEQGRLREDDSTTSAVSKEPGGQER